MIKNKLVSVIIPAFNEEKVIERLLISFKKQSYTKIEIIVVDDNSSDDTFNIAEKYTPLVFKRKHMERSAQRNFGASMAKGEYLFFLDADMELTKDVIRECVKVATENKKVRAVVVPEVSVASTYWEKVKAFERSFYNLEGDAVTDAARFFNSSVFNQVRGYDESLAGPEDWDLPERVKKAGYKIARVKSAIYHYERIPSLWRLMKKKYYYGLGSYKYLEKQEISILSPKTIYFLRPAFYKNWRNMVNNPFLTFSMFVMFFAELVSGGFGYLVGRWKSSS